jgi:hypothetical protein
MFGPAQSKKQTSLNSRDVSRSADGSCYRFFLVIDSAQAPNAHKSDWTADGTPVTIAVRCVTSERITVIYRTVVCQEPFISGEMLW